MPRTNRAALAVLLAALLAALPALVVAAVQAGWSLPFFSDDSFISLRYAERLLAGDGLTWTDGERVEGYSNLLWVLLCAGLGALGLDLVTAARLLGAICTAAALVVLARALPGAPAHAPRGDRRRALAAAAAGPLLVAASAPVLAWTLGGLEGPLVLLLLALGLGALVRDATRSPPGPLHALRARNGVAFALLCWTRPDGPLWPAVAGLVLAAFAARVAGARATLRALASFAALPLLAVAAQLAFRIVYYGDWVPNTAHVKVAFSTRVLDAGLDHVGHGLAVLRGLALPAALGAVLGLANARTRAAAAMLAATALVWLGWLASVGGDHFPGFRLFHPVLAPLGLLAALAVRALAATPLGTVAALLLAAGGATVAAVDARRDPLSAAVRAEDWEWVGEEVGLVLRDAFADERPLLAVDAAGAVPFFAELPALDMLGLCDRTIATSPPPPFVASVLAMYRIPLLPGHMLGNGDHVMDLQPDLMLFGQPPGLPLPVFASARDFEGDDRFLDGYRCIRVETGPRPLRDGRVLSLRVPLWVRVHGRAGVRESADGRIVVPAFLLGSYRQPRDTVVERHRRRPGRAWDPVPRDDPEYGSWDRDVSEVWRWFNTQDETVACVAGDGALELELRAHRAAELQLELPPGRFTVAAAPDAAIDLELVQDGDPTAGATATLRATPRPDAPLPQRLREVVLRPVR